ncbi:trypsin-like peptidase [Phycicoccus sp. SLBN-51]|nr:trypsin-like peptidase [Phycicoccus sp. SLBN-51]
MSNGFPVGGPGHSFCAHCGHALQPGGRFCPSCGASVAGRSKAPWLVAGVVALLVALGGGGWILMGRQDAPASKQLVAGATTTRPTAPSATVTVTKSPAVTASTTPSQGTGTFADLYRRVNSGVARIESTTCDGGGIGTGFLVDRNHVATAAHVVDGAAALSLKFGDKGSTRASGTVVGIDHDTDMALIKIDHPVDGHVFSLATASPRVGDEIAAIGFPVDEPMTLTRGSVSGLRRSIEIDGTNRSGMIQTDTAINPGNSGGPMLELDGKVYGIADAKRTDAEGIAYAVSPEVASSNLGAWRGRSRSVVSAPCDAPVAPPNAQDPDVQTPGGDVDPSVVSFFDQYFGAINGADYQTVWELLSPRLRGSNPSSLADGLATTFDTDVVVHSAAPKSSGRMLAHVSFTSFQSPDKGPDGDLCDEWDLDYLLTPVGGSWQINAVSGYQNGPTHKSC